MDGWKAFPMPGSDELHVIRFGGVEANHHYVVRLLEKFEICVFFGADPVMIDQVREEMSEALRNSTGPARDLLSSELIRNQIMTPIEVMRAMASGPGTDTPRYG